MSPFRVTCFLAIALFPAVVRAQEYKVEVLKEAPPAALSGAIRVALDDQGYRVLDDQGKPYADLWLRRAVPASSKPSGPKGAVLFPFLEEGELLGALRFAAEGHDYRDQSITKGVYTLRYGLQPVNGDHLGVSVNRDYALLLPAAKDKDLPSLKKKVLEERSAESAGSSHPAVLILFAAAESAVKADSSPSMAHDAEKNTWGVVLPLRLAVQGESGAFVQAVQLTLIGAAMN